MAKKRVLGVVGMGHVGAHVAYALAIQGIADELVLVDQNEQKLASEVQDLRDAVAYMPHRVTVRGGGFSDLGVCDVIVNSVGKIDLLRGNTDRVAEMKFTVPAVRSYVQKIKDSGFDATQATVSRDIKELRLVKTMGANGQYKYAVTKTESDELLSKFRSIFAQSVVSADYAGNTIVIRCYTGMAQAACAAFDSMHWEGLVGTLAGDDTIFALCRSESYASQMKDSIKRLIEK